MTLHVKTVKRLIHYYELDFDFKEDFSVEDNDQFRGLFNIIKNLSKTRANIRYQQFGEKAIFIQDVVIKPAEMIIMAKLRCVRKDILPEIMDTSTDEARGIEAKEAEGLLETTHFIIDFSKKKKRLAIEYNQFGARIIDFVNYLERIAKSKKAINSIKFYPLVKDELKTLKDRINRCSQFEVKVHKDNIDKIKSIDTGLYTALEASADHFKSDYAMLTLKFDYKERGNTKEVNSVIKKLTNILIKDKSKTELFSKLEVKAEDTKRNNRLQIFDLLIDKVKDEIKVEKKERYRTVVSNDIFPKMYDKLQSLK